MERLFHFKQFSMSDKGSAMKIGTDAVLLGAWTDCEQSDHILDIGSGCGILALMLAQRSKAQIVAIEPEESAFLQARENFMKSPWPDRFSVFQNRIQDFHPENPLKFDLIVCNPPFFQNSLLSPDKGRTLARHNHDLPQHELLAAVLAFGTDDVCFSLVIPADQESGFEEIADSLGLYCSRKLKVRTFDVSDVVRVFMEFRREKTSLVVEELVLRNADGSYSAGYQTLSKDYHPHF